MEPKILNGSTIWIDNIAPVENDQIGVFIIDGEASWKRFRVAPRGIYLESINPHYMHIRVDEFSELKVVGKVIL